MKRILIIAGFVLLIAVNAFGATFNWFQLLSDYRNDTWKLSIVTELVNIEGDVNVEGEVNASFFIEGENTQYQMDFTPWGDYNGMFGANVTAILGGSPDDYNGETFFIQGKDGEQIINATILAENIRRVEKSEIDVVTGGVNPLIRIQNIDQFDYYLLRLLDASNQLIGQIRLPASPDLFFSFVDKFDFDLSQSYYIRVEAKEFFYPPYTCDTEIEPIDASVENRSVTIIKYPLEIQSATPTEQAAILSDYIDNCYATGTLEGLGSGKSPDKKVNALINQIELAGYYLEEDMIDKGCNLLSGIYRKVDGESRPPDFVKGPCVVGLSEAVIALMNFHQCVD